MKAAVPWLAILLLQCHYYSLLSQNVTESASHSGNSMVTHDDVTSSENSTQTNNTVTDSTTNTQGNETNHNQTNITTQTTPGGSDTSQNTTTSSDTATAEDHSTGAGLPHATLQSTEITSGEKQNTSVSATDKEVTTQPFNDTGETKMENTSVQQNTTPTASVQKTDFWAPTGGGYLETAWMKTFLSIYHFDGWYTYDSGKFLFDFVSRFVHPTNSSVLVATFYDEDGAIFDMNGTSVDGNVVTFISSKMYSESYRFPTNIVLQFNGSFVNKGDNSEYSGTVTLPQNSSFQQFHMQKGKPKPISVDEKTSKTAVIVAVVACIAFIFVLGTVTLICWAMRKGYLRKNYKSYRPFRDSMVTYESDAETVHI